MSEHFIERCSGCMTVLSQCRCPSRNKTTRWGKCKRWPGCSSETTSAVDTIQKLTAELEQLKAENERHGELREAAERMCFKLRILEKEDTEEATEELALAANALEAVLARARCTARTAKVKP